MTSHTLQFRPIDHPDSDNCDLGCSVDLSTNADTWTCPNCDDQWTHDRERHCWNRHRAMV